MTDWVNEPVPWRKATWTPWGAGGLPEVKALLLPEMPEPPVKVHGEPVGAYWNWLAPTATCSKPGSPIEEVVHNLGNGTRGTGSEVVSPE